MLERCPRRNLLLLLGDFNVQLTTCPGITGTMPSSAHTVDCEDAEDFFGILQMFSLQVLNSFRGHVPTYVQETTGQGQIRGTMIDMKGMRQDQSDATARLCTNPQ